MIIVYAAIAFAITYFMLRPRGGVGRHVFAFLISAIVLIFLTSLTFEMMYPLGGLDSYRRSRYDAQMVYTVSCVAAVVIAPALGMLFARFSRRKKLSPQPS
jgi:hypothetical protein